MRNRPDSTVVRISMELNIRPDQAEAVLGLLEESATVPFIARYRKEATGGLDEVAVISIRDRYSQLKELDKRRESILAVISGAGKLSPQLEQEIRAAETMARLEDLYLPYRPKRKTRGSAAREKGLEPLADIILQGSSDPRTEAVRAAAAAEGIESPEEALQGAQDIISEMLQENAEVRKILRKLFVKEAVIRASVVKSKQQEAAKYRDYFDYSEPAGRAPSHRILAVFRGAEEKFLNLRVLPDEEKAAGCIRAHHSSEHPVTQYNRTFLEECFRDSYKRLIAPSLETELKNLLKAKADEDAIGIFSENLKELLMAPPLGGRAVLALDPGLRTGCKAVCLDPSGRLLHAETVYPLPPHNKTEEAAARLIELVRRFSLEAVAVGNGTGGREALAFCESLSFDKKVICVPVNESGASVYSASETARKEFPGQDLTVRGAVSIGRRLMDPLAELVKIDPKSIGVGQYQHDVDQKQLKAALDDTVTSCVNQVGVDLNTASPQLLRYVSGLNASAAEKIVSFRDSHGGFEDRHRLLDVPGIGGKSFEQAAGFLRISDGTNPLDASAVHPERYPLVERMAADAGGTVEDLMNSRRMRENIDPAEYVTEDAGIVTLRDILDELEKPGRDPRADFEVFRFAEQIHTMEDLSPGMVLPGIVTNVTAFGAFVDVGVHQDGLVHISEMSEEYVTHPSSIVHAGDTVQVRVLEVDLGRKRISLSLKKG